MQQLELGARAPASNDEPPSAREPRRGAPPSPFSLRQADALELLGSLPSGSVDLVVTDPPYESLEQHRAVGTTTRLKHSKASSNDWFSIFPNARFPELFAELHRVLARNAHLYLFSDATTLFVLKPAAEAAGFRLWKPLVWDKQRIGMGYHYRARYEFVLFLEKGKRRLADLGTPDVLSFPRIVGGYPTEKPVELARVFVEQSSSPGELVLDPFAGSGAVGVAAVAAGRRFLGGDVSPAALALAEGRLVATAAGATPGARVAAPPAARAAAGRAASPARPAAPGGRRARAPRAQSRR